MSNAIWKTRNQLDFLSFVGKWFGFMRAERYFREEKNGIQGWTLFCVVDILFFFLFFLTMKHTGQILHLPHMQVDKELRIFFSKKH